MSKLLVFLIIFPFSFLSAEPVQIGLLTDLAGPMASWGKQSQLGAEIAEDEINQNGTKLKLFYGDHQLKARQAVSELKKLIEYDKIDALYSEFTPTTIAIAPIIAKSKLPMIYAAAATSPLTNSPGIFKTYLDYEEGCKKIALLWKEKGLTKIGVLHGNLEFAELCLAGLKSVYPDFTQVIYNPGDELKSAVLLLKKNNVEAVMNVAFEPDFLIMLKSMQNLNWSPAIGTEEDAVTPPALSKFPALMENVTAFTLPELPESFLAKVREKDADNNMVSVVAAGLAYLHIKQLYNALSSCPENQVTCTTKIILKAAPNSDMGFEGWENQKAIFTIGLRTWKEGNTVDLQ